MSSTEQEPTQTPSQHYLVGRYVTHRPDGVHIEARCTCGVKLEGTGIDESEATEHLTAEYPLSRTRLPLLREKRMHSVLRKGKCIVHGHVNLPSLRHPRPVLQCLSQVAGRNLPRARQVGNGARQLEHPVVGTRR